jgi:hypothetical protein
VIRLAHFDLSEVRDLADDMAAVGRRVRPESRTPVVEAAGRIKRQWARNAEETGHAYAKWYAKSIGVDGPRWTGNSWVATVEPDVSLPQGGMSTGFEYGSINQTSPHLDAHRAVDSEEARFVDRCARIGEQILWGLIV